MKAGEHLVDSNDNRFVMKRLVTAIKGFPDGYR